MGDRSPPGLEQAQRINHDALLPGEAVEVDGRLRGMGGMGGNSVRPLTSR